MPKMGATVTTWIYIGHSPAHAETVALVLDPRTGRVSPQFHTVFDNLFTTVPFMNKSQLPTNQAELIKNPRELVTEEIFNLEKTWIFPESDSGDNASIPEPSPILQQTGNVGTNATPNIVPTASTTSNIIARSQARLPVCEGDNAPSSNNDLEAPNMIDMETSDLRRSKRIKNMMNPTNQNNYGPTIIAYT